jgi:AAA ATPase domain
MPLKSPLPRRLAINTSLACTFVGREREVRRLHQAILQREGLVIHGPAGIGKTALLSKVCSHLPAELAAAILYIESYAGLRGLLANLLDSLRRQMDRALLRQLRPGDAHPDAFHYWLRRQSTSHLRGSLYRCLDGARFAIFLDHVSHLTPAQAKVIREMIWARNTPVFLLTREAPETVLRRLPGTCWGDPPRLELGPLSQPQAAKLLEHCIRKFNLSSCGSPSFRREVLQLSGRVPGTIVKMCFLAQQARYRYGSQIKTQLLHIDCMMNTSPCFASPSAIHVSGPDL